jgi:O-antigen ligase
VVPLTARLAARNGRATTIVNVIIALGAAGALYGVVEYSLLNYDTLDKRPLGSLGHYMTYSGVIMLVLGATVARLLFGGRPRLWPAIAMPALVVALALTLARNAWVGAALAILVLLAFRQVRLFIAAIVAIPVLAGVVFVAAPHVVRDRLMSFTDKQDTGFRDRIAMLEAGVHMVRDHPLFGVGLNIVPWAWDQTYRPADAVDPQDGLRHTRSHLHNVPMQIAAERGLPALAVWIWFVAVALRDLVRQMRRRQATAIAAAGVAAIVGMLAAGLFEYNFGDSEFLILFLGLITLPWAAAEAERRKDVPAAMAA